jgi:hypothetical protein
MGYYQDLLDQILEVDKAGFNPYVDDYVAAIGKLEQQEAQISSIEDTPSDSTISNINTIQEPLDITQSYINAGFEDPFSNFVSDKGIIDYSKISTGYNQARENPDIGVTGKQYIDYMNKTYGKELDKTYGYEGAQYEITDDEGLRLTKIDQTKEDDTPSQYEKVWSNTSNQWLYLDTGEGVGGKAKKLFETEEEFNLAVEEYKKKQSKK